MSSAVKKNDVPEFLGQIIDIFEDFLTNRGIVLENDERDFDEDLDEEESANIYGDDYDELHDNLENMMCNWGIIERQYE